MNLYCADVGEARPHSQPCFKVFQLRGGAVGVNLHPAVVEIPGPTGDAYFMRRALREIAIADALYAPGDKETARADSRHVFLDYYVLTLNPELALIFDLDGVVVDSMPTHTLAWERYLEANGIDPRGIEARMHGKRNDDLVRDLFGSHLDESAVFDHGAAKERLFRELIGSTLEAILVPGIREFLAAASKTVPLAVGTNAEPANVGFILNGAGIRNYFRTIVDGSQVAQAKPAPDVYLRGAELLDVAPANCIVFEDSPVGIQAARAAGMRVVGLLTHASSLEDVDIAVPDFEDPELESWLSAQLSIVSSARKV
jgi:beta-phosphoglucomutase